MKNNYKYWSSKQNKIESSRGGWKIGLGVHNTGYDMMKDLSLNASVMQVFILNVTKKMPSREVADWFESLQICISWPDPRIWCNTMGALAGTNKARISSGISSAILSADSKMFGAGECVFNNTAFIQKALKKLKSGESVEDIVNFELNKNSKKMKNAVIAGYARPLAKGDERVESLYKFGRNLNFPIGEHEKLALDINDYLKKYKSEVINIGGYCASVMSDFGYSPLECTRLMTSLTENGVYSCFIEEEEKAPLSFMPLHCNDVEYKGKSKRKINKE